MQVSFNGLHYFKNYKGTMPIQQAAKDLHTFDGGDASENPFLIRDQNDYLIITNQHIKPVIDLKNILSNKFNPNNDKTIAKKIITQIGANLIMRNDCTKVDCSGMKFSDKPKGISFAGNYLFKNINKLKNEDLVGLVDSLNQNDTGGKQDPIRMEDKYSDGSKNSLLLTGRDANKLNTIEKKYAKIFNIDTTKTREDSTVGNNSRQFILSMMDNFVRKSDCINIDCSSLTSNQP